MPIATHKNRPDPQKSLVGFVVGPASYALEIGCVREIVNPLPITPLPHTPPDVAGVADHRGDVVPVIELRVRFGLDIVPPTRTTKWILVDLDGRTIGLVVDRVTEVFGTGGEELGATPAVGGDRDARGIRGVVRRAGQLTFVLDTQRFRDIVSSLEAAGALEP
jgi:purine-binding chemotaxis protein CheW